MSSKCRKLSIFPINFYKIYVWNFLFLIIHFNTILITTQEWHTIDSLLPQLARSHVFLRFSLIGLHPKCQEQPRNPLCEFSWPNQSKSQLFIYTLVALLLDNAINNFLQNTTDTIFPSFYNTTPGWCLSNSKHYPTVAVSISRTSAFGRFNVEINFPFKGWLSSLSSS